MGIVNMAWKLEATTGEHAGQSISVDRDMLVGRHQEADVLLQVADISRRHAALLLKDGALWVQDLNSSNGTFLNDNRLEVETQVQQGDQLRFSSVGFVVVAPSVEELEAPAVEAEVVQEQVVEPTPAQKMNEQGMPTLADRSVETTLNANGMPVNVGIPKPAPIPANVDIHAPTEQSVRVTETDMEIPAACVEQEQDAQKNVKVGLISIISLVVLAIIAWLFFK